MPRHLSRFLPVNWGPDQRSTLVFAIMLGLALFAVTFPEAPPQVLQGILWSGAGLVMLVLPPEEKLPRVWWLLAGGFLMFSLAGFLPLGDADLPAWRANLERLGLDTGGQRIVQAFAAAETMAGFAATTLAGLFMLGHRVGSRQQQRLAVAFVLGVAIWVSIALLRHRPEQVFGFFPNRNHTATLLAMGAFTALACLAHGIDRRQGGLIVMAVLPLLLFLYALLGVSESRAGIVLLVAGLLAWIPLAGFRYLRGHAGKAVLLLVFGLAGTFLVTDSRVKERVMSSLSAPGNLVKDDASPAGGGTEVGGLHSDGRLPIYRDSWRMVRSEPWTGVGPGQFVWIFPQYRNDLGISSETPCLHPESDWLMILVENGWPAAACLATGVVLVLVAAFARARHGRSRGLRMGCALAGSILCLHGVFDVPGHRVGLAWNAVLLVALSLRPGEIRCSSSPKRPGRFHVGGWRAGGLVLFGLGLVLLHAEWSGRPMLPSGLAAREMEEMQRIYESEQATGVAGQKGGRMNPAARATDPLRKAMDHARRSSAIYPLNPQAHFTFGLLGLHFNGGEQQVERAFSFQRQLSPQQVTAVVGQARAWGIRDPDKVRELWAEALRRAAEDEARFPWSQVRPASTYQAILHDAARDERLSAIALDLGAENFRLLEMWVLATPPAVLDQYFPRISGSGLTPDQRQRLFRIWKSRGSKAAVEAHLRESPKFLSPAFND